MPSKHLVLCCPLQCRDGNKVARYLSCLSSKNNVYVGAEIRLAKPNRFTAFNQRYFTNVCKCLSRFFRPLTHSRVCVCVCVCVHRKLGIWKNMLKLGVKGSQTVSPKTVPSKSLAFRLCMSKSKADEMGTFLAIQRLRLCSYVGGTSLTPGQGSQILQAAKYSREIKNK